MNWITEINASEMTRIVFEIIVCKYLVIAWSQNQMLYRLNVHTKIEWKKHNEKKTNKKLPMNKQSYHFSFIFHQMYCLRVSVTRNLCFFPFFYLFLLSSSISMIKRLRCLVSVLKVWTRAKSFVFFLPQRMFYQWNETMRLEKKNK